MKSNSSISKLAVLCLLLVTIQIPENANASDVSSDVVYNGTEFVPAFENAGIEDSIESSNSNSSGSRTLRTKGNHTAVFQSLALKSEGLVVAAIADDRGVALGLHLENPENALVLIDDVVVQDLSTTQLHFKSLEAAPNVVQIRSTRAATAAELRADYGRQPTAGIGLQHISSVSIDLRGLKSEAQRIGKFGRAAVLPAVTTVRNVTFIPESWLNAPFVGCADYPNFDFKGDNRSWSASSSAYRTKFDVAINWNSGPSLTSTRAVGETSLWFNVFGTRTLSQAATASNSSMVLTPISSTNSTVTFKMYQDVKNPLCINFLTNGIFSNLNWSVSRLGSYSVQGTYMPVPNHEAYISSSSSSSWVTVFQTAHQNYLCLTGGVSVCTTTRANSGAF
ncbi:MAG: hypothetical protein RJA66_473 [Actinomycetota bacterium]|jgi:hypothetical protein